LPINIALTSILKCFLLARFLLSLKGCYADPHHQETGDDCTEMYWLTFLLVRLHKICSLLVG